MLVIDICRRNDRLVDQFPEPPGNQFAGLLQGSIFVIVKRKYGFCFLMLLLVVWLSSVPAVFAQPATGLTLAALPTDLEDQRLPLVGHDDLQLIRSANGLIKQQDIASALDRMDRLVSQSEGKLVSVTVTGLPLGYRRFISVESFVRAWHHRLAQQIPVVWREHQLRYDRFAQRDEAAISDLTIENLQQLLDRWPYSSEVRRWRMQLGDSCFQAGRLLAARMHWQQALHDFKRGKSEGEYAGRAIFSFSEPTAEQKKILQVRKFIGEVVDDLPELAQQTLDSMLRQGDAELSLAGRRGSTQELLTQFYWQHFSTGEVAGSVVDFPRTQAASIPEAETFQHSPRWVLNLASQTGKTLQVAGRLEVVPAVHESRMYVNTLNAIIAIDVRTGKPAWGQGSDAYRVYQHGDHAEASPWYDEEIPYWGVARGVVEISGDRLIARVGDPTNTYHQSLQRIYRQRGAIVALDLSGEGSLISGFPIYPNGRSANAASRWTFVSAPKIAGDRILVLLRESTELQCRNYVACYSLNSGQELWKTFIGAAPVTGRQTVSTLEPAVLVTAGDRLVACSNSGQVACLGLDGRLCWVNTYPQRYQQAGLAELEAPLLRGTSIVVGRRELVVTIYPADGTGIFQVDLFSGAINWVVEDSRFGGCRLLANRSDGREMLVGNGLFVLQEPGRFNSALNPSLSYPVGLDGGIHRPLAAVFADDGHYYYLTIGNKIVSIQIGLAGLENRNPSLELVSGISLPPPVASLLEEELSEIIFGSEMVFLFDGKMIVAMPGTGR